MSRKRLLFFLPLFLIVSFIWAPVQAAEEQTSKAFDREARATPGE